MRYGPDAVLVDTSSYVIDDIRYGLFDDGGAEAYVQGYRELPGLDPHLPRAFIAGDLNLGNDPDRCSDSFYDRRIDDDWRAEDWNALALDIADSACPSDLSYYLLELAAEGLVLPEAAAAFYQVALDIADSSDDDFRCAAYEDDPCRGLDIGDEAAAGLERIFGPRLVASR